MRRLLLPSLTGLLLAATTATAPCQTPTGEDVSAVTAQGPEPSEDLPARHDVLTMFGERVGASSYGEWLVRWRGPILAPQYIARLVLERKAHELGCEVAPDHVQAALEEQIRVRVTNAFGGDREAWLAELAQSGRSEAGFRAQRTEQLAFELVRNEVVRRLRVVDEERLVAEWEQLYGPQGRRMAVNGILRRVEAQISDESRTREEVLADAAARRAEAARELSGVAGELERGASFAVLAGKLSDDETSRERGGRLTDEWTRAGWPVGFTEALVGLEPGQVTEPLEGRGGVWVLQLAELETTPFEAVREEVRRSLDERPPEQRDVQAVLDPLLEAAEVVHLPALSDPDMRTLAGRAAPVFTLDGVPLSLERFEGWVRHVEGEVLADRYVTARAVERAAKGIELEPSAIERRIDEDLAIVLDLGFSGSKQQWLDNLATRRRDEASWREEARIRARHDLLCEALLRKDDPVDEEDARAAWAARYGEDGVDVDVRLIRKRVAVEPQAEDESKRQYDRRVGEALDAIWPEFEALVERTEEGEDFGALAREVSDHPSAATGGRPGPEFDVSRDFPLFRSELLDAPLGAVIGPLRSETDLFLFEVVGRREVPFESVKDTLLEELRTQRLPGIQIAAKKNELLKSADYEVLPGMFR